MSATAAAVIEFPMTMPPTGTMKRGVASKMPSPTTSDTVTVAASASAMKSGQKAFGTFFAREFAVNAPKVTIAARRTITKISWS
jgi:hypothetical protein